MWEIGPEVNEDGQELEANSKKRHHSQMDFNLREVKAPSGGY